MSNIKVIINDKTYTLNLENNTTVDEFINLLPEEYNMSDLNDNEKYTYLDKSLSTNQYNTFDTTYSYTKIGHIDNLDNLGSGNIKVRIEK